MAEELFKVRPVFAANVSLAVMEDILDDLLTNKVLSDGEREALLEGNPTRRNKARTLLDNVRRKGDAASWKMMDSLKKHDPELFKELGLPTQSFKEAAWADGSSSSKNSRTLKKNDEKIYPVTPESIKSRVALLITNITFRDAHKNRNGAERDEQNMEMLLQTFGYEVVKYRDCTGKQVDKAVLDFSMHPKLKDTDSVFVVIMSHGRRGHVLGVNWSHKQTEEGATEEEDVFPIDNIFKHLASDKCKALENKPKIVIIQACRGNEKGTVFNRDGAKKDLVCDNASASDDHNMVDDGLRYMHKEKDFIAFLSCTPVSYRNPVTGSVLIRHLVDVLNTCAQEEHIEELFRMVTQRFEKSDLKYGQMPNKDRVSLTKNFYLFPGN
ncbi:caspase a-like isoform X2 [Nerophis lumbriciformis]|uniref:caspase a-like isoform X2 n=1 Tax=Nerophis lumbriciformis TaxID=546530 RepID=UPI002ADF1917|nr:caspase a-like isoform X2 [Nerophis lumbriciformis]